jgi:predicted DNA-binding protein YlxM (UPF0122 family)
MAKNMDMALLIDIYSPALTENQRDMLELYYYEDLSLSEIAQNSGISRQGVRDAIKRGEAVMLELEKGIGLAKKQRTLIRVTERIRRNAKEIMLYNNRLAYIEQVDLAANDILAALDEIEKQ